MCVYIVLCLEVFYGEQKSRLKCPVNLCVNNISKPRAHPESQRAALAACVKKKKKSNRVTEFVW